MILPDSLPTYSSSSSSRFDKRSLTLTILSFARSGQSPSLPVRLLLMNSMTIGRFIPAYKSIARPSRIKRLTVLQGVPTKRSANTIQSSRPWTVASNLAVKSSGPSSGKSATVWMDYCGPIIISVLALSSSQKRPWLTNTNCFAIPYSIMPFQRRSGQMLRMRLLQG